MVVMLSTYYLLYYSDTDIAGIDQSNLSFFDIQLTIYLIRTHILRQTYLYQLNKEQILKVKKIHITFIA